ncbi:MAG: hypothetical protein LBK82_08835 [Planctomycetaceae bacterium]|nr:hypothetical protein [Planctomycetaceae bacterium]
MYPVSGCQFESKTKVTQFTAVNLIHCRRVRRHNLLAKGCPPCFCFSLPIDKH